MSLEVLVTIDYIASLAHNMNRAYCELNGDFSQKKWDYAPQWQRESAVNGVRFHLANPDATPADSHISWRKEKDLTGWVYGPVKNEIAKEHPCMVDYDLLPVSQRVKDYLFKALVDAYRSNIK